MQITELKELIAESSGDPVDTIDSTQSFLDMGYDSLMVLEMAALLKNRHGVELSDDDHVLTQTPEDLLAVVNGAKA
ncbi:acyl carrier protein [Enemella evansiae]|uniref:acyl carrier protein n=1 Tax=Enemella evansiae TaxID=2016499 RepID=UPI001596049B|nr:acyl carrier protein [Enemella evansiae]